MRIQNEYLNDLMERVVKRDPGELEFHQAVREVLASLAPVAMLCLGKHMTTLPSFRT